MAAAPVISGPCSLNSYPFVSQTIDRFRFVLSKDNLEFGALQTASDVTLRFDMLLEKAI